jgi:hypothetical protein
MSTSAIRRPRKAQVYLLFDNRPRIDLPDIVATLKRALDRADRSDKVELLPSGLVGWGQFFASVEVVPSPLARVGFQLALGSPITDHWAPHAAAMIARHESYVAIEVSFGPALPDLTPDIENMLETTGAWPMPNEDAFLSMLMFAQHLAFLIGASGKATLVHWMQSNQLFSMENFTTQALSLDPVTLHVHPIMFTAPDPKTGRTVQSAMSYGAAHLIGREVTFEPTDAPAGYMASRILYFVEFVRVHRKGQLIPHGETFGESADEIIRVLHVPPSADNPQGGITLRLESRPGGTTPVRPPPPPTSEIFQPAKLDEQVEADRALIRAMRQSLISSSAGNTAAPAASKPGKPEKPAKSGEAAGLVSKLTKAAKSPASTWLAIALMAGMVIVLAKDIARLQAQTPGSPGIERAAP